MRALLETLVNHHFVLAQQIVDEFLARVTRSVFCPIYEAERGRRVEVQGDIVVGRLEARVIEQVERCRIHISSRSDR